MLGDNSPTLEQVKDQVFKWDSRYVGMLKYFAQQICSSGNYWRNKMKELENYIDFHVSSRQGQTTHFINILCAECWWLDVQRLIGQLEMAASRQSKAEMVARGNFATMMSSVKRYTLYVNKYVTLRTSSIED